MRQIMGVLVGLVFLSGCVVTTSTRPLVVQPAASWTDIALGTERQEVRGVLDRQIVVGYEIDEASGMARPLMASALVGSEILPCGETTYLIDRFVPPGGSSIDLSSDDGLAALIFLDGRLEAKGEEAVATLRKACGGQ